MTIRFLLCSICTTGLVFTPPVLAGIGHDHGEKTSAQVEPVKTDATKGHHAHGVTKEVHSHDAVKAAHPHGAVKEAHSHDAVKNAHPHGVVKEAHSHKDYGSLKDAWKLLDNTVAKAEVTVSQGDFKTVDGLNHELQSLVHYLQDNSKAVDETKQKRLQGGLKQLAVAVGELHEQGHHPTKEGLEKTLKNVRGSMKLAEAQYPEGTIK